MGTYYTLSLLESMSYCAVDTYGLISGFVGIGSRQRPSRIAELWLRVIWYSGLGTVLGVFVFHHPVEEDTVFKALLPTLWNTYWYFSSYVGVFVIAPFLNKMVRALSDRERRRLMLALFVLCTCLTIAPRVSMTTADFLSQNAGYSFVWLSVLYVEGACIRMLCESESEGWNFLLGRTAGAYAVLYFSCAALTWGSKILIENHTRAVYGQARYGRVLESYVSPSITLCAFALLMIFSRLRIEKAGLRSVIRFLSPLAFSVYLVQLQPYFWDYVLKGRFAGFSGFVPAAAASAVLVWSLILYALCSGIDLVRMAAFRLLHVRQGLEKLTNMVLGPLQRMTE